MEWFVKEYPDGCMKCDAFEYWDGNYPSEDYSKIKCGLLKKSGNLMMGLNEKYEPTGIFVEECPLKLLDSSAENKRSIKMKLSDFYEKEESINAAKR